jgi:hypothetical protein
VTARKWISDLPLPVDGQPWPPSPSRLAEIKDRAQAAGPGPWKRRGRYVPADIVDAERDYVGEITTSADADFIAHARQDIDDLLTEVQRLKGVLRDAVDQIAELESDLGSATARIAELETELAGAREKALSEAAGWFDCLADFEPDQSYRARVMRGAANDIRRLRTLTER